jgi:hypothetical protein
MSHLVTAHQPTNPEGPASQAAKYMQKWGELGAVWFAQGKTWDEASILQTQRLQARITELEAERDKLLAQAKNRSGLLWWFFSLFLGPIATFLIVVLPKGPPSIE